MNDTRKPLQGSGRVETQYKKVEKGSQTNSRVTKLRFSFILKHASTPDISDDLTRKQALALLRPSEEAVEMVKAFADEHGLKIESVNLPQRKVTLSGNQDQIEAAFRVKLIEYAHPEGNYLSHEGELHLPEALHKDVIGIIGLHLKPVMKPQAQHTGEQNPAATSPTENQEVYTNYPTVLAKLYDFPEDLDGTHQKIALLQLGGGYNLSDLKTYFKSLHLRLPVIKDISVDGGTNNPQPNDMKTLEVYSDICMAGSVANRAELLVYFAGNNHLHALVESFQAAIYDEDNEPGIISCSWGSAEKEWNPNDIDILESVLKDASRLHITTFVASGDAGSRDDATGINVDYPASSPWVLGCGGTVAYVDPQYNTIVEEIVWNGQAGTSGATGGGVSAKIPLPHWQQTAGVPELEEPTPFKGRGVPDFSAVAGYHKIFMFGKPAVTGGTSCGAPFLAGLMALANQKAGKNLGYINEVLYKSKLVKGNKICQDITMGNNGRYKAGKGWNPCTGLGRPFGKHFVDVLVSELAGEKNNT